MPPRTAPELVGRDDELRRALDALGRGSETGALLVGGDAGIGKTALVRRLAALAGDDVVLLGHCAGDVGALPYLPFAEMFGGLDRADRGLVDGLVAEHPGLVTLVPRLAVAAARDTARGDVVEGVHGALAALGRLRETLVVVEDVHWADDSTRELLTLLLTRGVPEGVRLVVTYRSDDIHRRHPLAATLAVWARLPGLARLDLGPLRDGDVRRIVRGLADDLRDDVVDAVARRAEGNAFFAEELVAAAGSGTGADLTRLLLARVDRLDERTQAVVRVAAVVGRRVPHALLERVADVDAAALAQCLRAAVEHHVLEPWGEVGYAFRHALLAEAVSDDLLPTERLRLHRACVAALLEDSSLGTAADLARHALAAGDGSTARTASVRAGDTALHLGGPADALRHYEAALSLAGPDDGEAHDLTLRAAEAAAAAGRAARAIAVLQDRLGHPGATGNRRAELLAALAFAVRLTEAEPLDRVALTEEAVGLLTADTPPPLRVRVLARRAEALVDAHRAPEALELAEEAMSLAVAHDLRAERVDLTVVLARLSEAAGDPAASIRRLADAVEDRTSTADVAFVQALHILASVHYRQGDLPAALGGYERAVAEARRAGLAAFPYGVDAAAMAVTVAYEVGEWDRALDLAAASAGDALPEDSAASVEAAAALVRAARGDVDVERLLTTTRSWWPEDSRIAVQVGTAAIETYGRQGETARMLEVHEEVVSRLRLAWGRPRIPVEVRYAALLVGHLADAARGGTAAGRADLAASVERLAEQGRAVWGPGSSLPPPGPEGRMWVARLEAEVVRARHVAGAAVDEADLESSWREAAGLAQAHGDPYELARCRARLAEVLSAAGDPEAGVVAAAAREAADRLGAGPLLAALDRLTPRTAAAGLTTRESEVLALLAAGRSNGDIGRALFITTKTASVHVSNILAKLGAASRGEAVAVARSRGLLGPSD